jgi:protein-tyrosine-phosphatase
VSGREGRPLSILFVCLGNLCRSPMAEGIAREAIASRYPGSEGLIRVSSAGLSALEGEPATCEAVRTMSDRGIDISAHRARLLNASILSASDMVLVMEARQRRYLSSVGAAIPAFLLMQFGEAAAEVTRTPDEASAAPEIRGRLEALARAYALIDDGGLWLATDYEVPDPMGFPLGRYEEVASMMDRPVSDILDVLLAGPGNGC